MRLVAAAVIHAVKQSTNMMRLCGHV